MKLEDMKKESEGHGLTTSIPEEIVNAVEEYVAALIRGENLDINQVQCDPKNRKELTSLLNVAKLTYASIKPINKNYIEISQERSLERIKKLIEK